MCPASDRERLTTVTTPQQQPPFVGTTIVFLSKNVTLKQKKQKKTSFCIEGKRLTDLLSTKHTQCYLSPCLQTGRLSVKCFLCMFLDKHRYNQDF